MSGFDLEGNKIWELDISKWHVWRETLVPNKNLAVFTELSACPQSLLIEDCDSEPEGFMFNIASGTVVYHSAKFARNAPTFSAGSKYMLGRFGFGDSIDGSEYYFSTGTCLMQTDTGQEVWCKEEVVSQQVAFMSEAGKIIVGDRAVYDFFSGKKVVTFPQFAKKGDKVYVPQMSGEAVIIRAVSPEGKYFVATEGTCDHARDKADACELGALKNTSTYLAEWHRGVFKARLKDFEGNYQDINLRPFIFMPDGTLAVTDPYQQRIQFLNVKGEVLSEIAHDSAVGLQYYWLWQLQPEIDFANRVVIWPLPKDGKRKIYDFSGKLIGQFAWDDPKGRKFQVLDFKMINSREYVFGVDIRVKERPGEAWETILEVYKGKFEDKRAN